MDSDNVAEFQNLVQTAGKQFKNDKPIELAKFEVTQDDIIRGIKAGGELAAAVVTGGGSMLAQVVLWLAKTLPDLWTQVKAVLSLIDGIKSFRSAGIGNKVSSPPPSPGWRCPASSASSRDCRSWADRSRLAGRVPG